MANGSDQSPLTGDTPAGGEPATFPRLDAERIGGTPGPVRDLRPAGAVPVASRRRGAQGLRGSVDRRSIGGGAR